MVPSWIKPVYLPIVGSFFRDICESPAENGSVGIILIMLAQLVFIICAGLDAFGTGVFLATVLTIWGLAHIAICYAMVTVKEYKREQNRKMHAQRRADIAAR